MIDALILAENKVREELSQLLTEKPVNYVKILELSSQLAAFDKENVRFTVDAGVIDRLGKELVARHETAVSELVKNAYDADATMVDLIFENTSELGGKLTIDDDGDGMSRTQLIGGFMRISSTDKVHNPYSKTYNRKRAGKKGIGRFATQRLGSKLTITTQTIDADTALQLVINWDQFHTDQDLNTISNSIATVPKTKSKGTTLLIENLHEWWSVSSIKRVYRYSIDVIQPFPLPGLKQSSETAEVAEAEPNADPGFLVRCFQSINGSLDDVADEASMIFDHALAIIDGEVDSEGYGKWSVASNKLGIEKITISINPEQSDKTNPAVQTGDTSAEKEAIPYPHLRNVKFRAYYFLYNIGKIPKLAQGYIQEKAKEAGGFRLYRNGFRVLPYGEPQNDWLGLDESVRRRLILPGHGNNNFFGLVEVQDADDKLFNELSSREGLFYNDAYEELVEFVYRSVLNAVMRIADVRNKKKTSDQKDWTKEEKLPVAAVQDIADELDALASEFDNKEIPDNSETANDQSQNEPEDNGEENGPYNKQADQFRRLSEKLRFAIGSLEEVAMLRVLAGLGLTIGEFTHEIKQYLPAFDVDSEFLIKNLPRDTEVYARASRLKESFLSFNIYASYFDKTISQNAQRELVPIELRDAVNSFLKVIKPDIERNSFTVETTFEGYDLFTTKMHPSEWASILFNLYSNAKKAIKRGRKLRNMLISAGAFEDKVYLHFNDTGDGIPKENEERIFNAFFTTSSQRGHSATADQELTGTGLGLKIIKDIIESYAGEISLVVPADGFSTCFRIEVPKAQKEDIEKYDL